ADVALAEQFEGGGARADRAGHAGDLRVFGLVFGAGVLAEAEPFEVTNHREELADAFVAKRVDLVADANLILPRGRFVGGLGGRRGGEGHHQAGRERLLSSHGTVPPRARGPRGDMLGGGGAAPLFQQPLWQRAWGFTRGSAASMPRRCRRIGLACRPPVRESG